MREKERLKQRVRVREKRERFGSLCITPISLPCAADQPALNGDH